jgi:DNA polymerase I
MGVAEDILRERGFRRMWALDTEYRSEGGRPRTRCLCALDMLSGERREVWLAGVVKPLCPFEMAADECFIFFAADADVGVFINLGWPIPRHVIDARVEFMRIRNGLAPLPSLDGGNPDIAAAKEAKASKKRHKKPGQFSLSRITRHYRIPFIEDEAKGEFRDLAMRPGDYFTDAEIQGMVDYCRGDVDATAEVLRRVWDEAGLSDPRTLNQALIRGFYMSASAWVQFIGTPIDLPLYRRFSMNAVALRSAVLEKHIDRFDVYECGHFNHVKYASFVEGEGLLGVWPRTPKGHLATGGRALENFSESYPIAGDFLLFADTISMLEGIGSSFNEAGEIEEDEDIAKGLRINADGRNHAPLLPFTAKTSRNAPPGRAFLFTNPIWMRYLIRPEKGRALAFIDWVSQELRIAAARSRDPALLALCAHADPYIELAITLGLAPPGATKNSHKAVRKIAKVLTLAMLYGAGPRMIAAKAKWSLAQAIDVLRRLRSTFATFFAWSDNFAYRGLCAAPIWSPLGWRFWPQYWKDDDPPDRTCRNYPVQSAGSDRMRVSAIRALEAGIRICAIVHDEFVIEARDGDIGQAAKVMGEIMMNATEDVIGVSIPVDYDFVRHGEPYYNEDGEEDFKVLMLTLEDIEQIQKVA